MNLDRFSLAEKELEKYCTYSPEQNFVELFCVLHNVEYLGIQIEGSHSCLGCILNESFSKIYRFIKDVKSKDDIEYVFTIYILLSYLLIEKLNIIFKIIGLTQNYVQEKWPVLIELRKWANFIKHPKGFLFNHHAEYFYEGFTIPIKWENYKQITYKNVVEPLYKHEDEKKFQESMAQLSNKGQLLVMVPDPLRLSNELINACAQFCDKIRDNPHFKEMLKKHTVLENYF